MKRPDPALLDRRDEPDPGCAVKVIERLWDKAGTRSPLHWHEEPQFFLLHEGRATIYCHSGPLKLESDEAVVLNPGELHRIENLGARLEFTIVRFALNFVASFRPDGIQAKYIEPIGENRLTFSSRLGADPVVIGPLSLLIAASRERQPAYELLMKAKLLEALGALVRGYAEWDGQGPAQPCVAAMRRLKPTFDLIDAQLSSELGTRRLADEANMSEAYFCRLFKRLTGSSPAAYVQARRIERAASLIGDGGMGVSDAAFAVGFNDSGYFSRVFKRLKGMAPTEYCRSNSGNAPSRSRSP